MIQAFDQLLDRALLCKGMRVVVVYPNNAETLHAVYDACERGLADFTLVGNRDVIDRVVSEMGKTTQPFEVTHHASVTDTLKASIQLVQNGGCDVLMKGGVDTSTMMRALLREEAGIRTGRLLSDIFIFEYPKRAGNKFIMITDGGMNLTPDLKDKTELINNAVEVAHALGNTNPKVAILSAAEFLNPNLQSTIDAAILSKMNERGQIKGCIVDGPLALDSAISEEAAAEKKLASPVAGYAEILVAPNIESANSLAKSTTYFAGLRLAHVIVGAAVPILISSRADKADAKLLSVALGVLMSEYRRNTPTR